MMEDLINRLMTHFVMAAADGKTNLADDLAEAIRFIKVNSESIIDPETADRDK